MSSKKENRKEKNALVSTESKELTAKRLFEDIRRSISDPNNINVLNDRKLSEYSELEAKNKLTPAETKKRNELLNEIAQMYGLKNGLWAANLSYHKYYPTLAETRLAIVKDYDCKSALELMLADRITSNYWRAMRNDTLLNSYMENEDGSFSYSQLKINAIKEFNKGIERADRQLNADIILLKELKQPKLNIKVSTETAYIAQNQQIVNPTKNSGRTASSESLEADDLGKK